jgi:hypothetical protein
MDRCRRPHCFITPLLALVALTVTSGLVVASNGLTADEIVTRVNGVSDGEQVTRKLSMELTDRHGKSRLRDTINYRRYDGEVKKTVILFLAPANVRDTAFLTWDYADPEQEDDQWLYLPALGKVRRVSAADRGDYFLGTDFTYEDLKLDGKLSTADYVYSRYEGEEASSEELQEGALIRLVAVPRTPAVAEELGYSRTVITIDPANWIVMEVAFWDVKGRQLKHLVASDVREVDGIWTRHILEMDNLQTGHHTRLVFSDVDYSTAIKEELFTRQSLSRGH